MARLDYATLRDAVAGSAPALRCRTVLQPAGGPGTKVFPPTYGVSQGARTRYAMEKHHIDGKDRDDVILDSVAAQANAHEDGLLAGLEAGELDFPNPFVDFTEDEDLADLGTLSALQVPHRLADAIFRDSLIEGTLFRLSDLGRWVTDATPNNATAMYATSPASLFLGIWDSTGPKGGLGSKFQRALTSEIIGENAQLGVSVGSRIDPLQIGRTAAFVYEAADPNEDWTLNEAEAKREKGKPVGVGKAGELGRPSVINHGNVTPSIVDQAGGVTIDRAIQTTVLSLAALRKLRFVTATDGKLLDPASRREAELAARTAVAALTVAAIAYQREQDYDLRSRCLLVPQEAPELELVPRYGGDSQKFEISVESAAELLRDAAAAAADAGMGWSTEQVRLVPAPKLKDLIRKNRLAFQSVTQDEVEA